MRKFFILFFILLLSDGLLAETLTIPEVRSQKKNISKPKLNPLQITHFSQTEIKSAPPVIFSELLKQEQSVIRVINNSNDSNQTVLSIRGFGDNAVANTLILVDGFPLINSSLLAPNINSITLADIERVDILQGSEGSLWGDQAVGGVVNIITRHPGAFFVSGNLGVGSFNNQFYNLYASKKFANGLFLKVSAFTHASNQYRDHNRAADNNINLQVGFDAPRGTTFFNLQSFNSQIQFPGGLTFDEYKHHPRMATNTQNQFHYRTNQYQWLNKYELTSEWLLETRIMQREVLGEGFVFRDANNLDSIFSIEPQLKGTLLQNKILLGYKWQNNFYHLENNLVNNKVKAIQNNLYAQTIIPLVKHLEMILGTRFAWQNNQAHTKAEVNSINKVLVAETGMAYQLNDSWQFFLRRDGNFRFPKANELTWTPPNITSLKAETGVSYETGTTFRTALQQLQLNLYRLNLNHEIAFDPTLAPEAPFGSFKNFAETQRDGITLTETYQLSRKLKAFGQANYVRPQFSSGPFKGNQIPAVPNFNGNIGMNYDWNDHWKTKLNSLYTGSQYPSEDENNVSAKLPGYWLTTIALQYVLQSLQTSFEIVNAFNQKYAAYTRYDPLLQENIYYPGAGRSYLLTLKVDVE